jgi:hypothetical protein
MRITSELCNQELIRSAIIRFKSCIWSAPVILSLDLVVSGIFHAFLRSSWSLFIKLFAPLYSNNLFHSLAFVLFSFLHSSICLIFLLVKRATCQLIVEFKISSCACVWLAFGMMRWIAIDPTPVIVNLGQTVYHPCACRMTIKPKNIWNILLIDMKLQGWIANGKWAWCAYI